MGDSIDCRGKSLTEVWHAVHAQFEHELLPRIMEMELAKLERAAWLSEQDKEANIMLAELCFRAWFTERIGEVLHDWIADGEELAPLFDDDPRLTRLQ
jgi:hypothetical protein